ncbi:plexin-A4, partial, partial [Paramuricea clavata]
MLGVLRGTCTKLMDMKARRTLYLSLVKSQLCYATEVWSRVNSVQISRLVEEVQRRTTRWITMTKRGELSYRERLLALVLLLLTYDREVRDLVYFFKSLFSYMDVNIDNHVLFGKYLRVEEEKDLLKYSITVGGEKCNITSIAQEVIYCKAPLGISLPKQDSYKVLVNVSSSTLRFTVGELKYDITGDSTGSSVDMQLIYIIIGVAGAIFLIVVLLMWCLYRRKKRQQEQNERTYELQLNSLESKVAKECREAFAELQTDMTDFTTDLGDGSIHFFDFKNYAMRVLFPGVNSHSVMKEKMAQEDPKWDEALRTFSQLIGNKNFLLIFVRTLESQAQFKMQDRCNVASLLVIALQSKMDYCTDILQDLLAELIRKSMSKSHPKLLLRRTECIAEKLLTNWLTFTLSNFVKDKAGRPLFLLYKAIRFQIEKGPVDVITHEARYSLSEDKLLRQSIEYNKLTVTVEYEDNPPVQVDVLDTDTIEQAKEKIMEVLFKNTPYSCRNPKDELTLKWVESPSKHTILKDEDVTSVREGEWKRLNTLGHYQVPDRTCLRLVKRFAGGLDTSGESLRLCYASGICSGDEDIQSHLERIIGRLCKGYFDLYKRQSKSETLKNAQKDEFFGLRDFYSLVKMVYGFAVQAEQGDQISDIELEQSIRRNFSGLDDLDPVKIFSRQFPRLKDCLKYPSPECHPVNLIQESLGRTQNEGESRYLLVLTENYAALRLLHGQFHNHDPVIIFGSSFPKDQQYTQ